MCYTRHMRCALLTYALLIPTAVSFGQACPQRSEGPTVPSEVRTLEGQLVFHDGIRKWFELKLDEPQCGQGSIELVGSDQSGARIEILRGCRVSSRGPIDISLTGYFSLSLYQQVGLIEPVGACERQAPFQDSSKVKPDKAIRAYRVDMRVNYEPGDHPVVFRVTDGRKELRPWQAYANYDLTGGFVLYGRCGDGFVVDKVFGTPEAHPLHFDSPGSPWDMAAFDPESVAATGRKDMQLGYTCVRSR